MSNTNITSLECTNPDVVRACALQIQCSKSCEVYGWAEGATKISAITRDSIPSATVLRVSKEYPKDGIICEYYFEQDGYAEAHIVKYQNGKEEFVDIEPCYHCCTYEWPDLCGNDRDGIIDKAVDFYRRVDTTDLDNDGKMYLRWSKEEVCNSFVYDGEDGGKYRVDTKNHLDRIKFKIAIAVGCDEWQTIVNEIDIENRCQIS
jgi:hypothetical protein